MHDNKQHVPYLQIVLMKQLGPVPLYSMQLGNISHKNSYFPHFAPRKQMSCNVNEPKQCISTWQLQQRCQHEQNSKLILSKQRLTASKRK